MSKFALILAFSVFSAVAHADKLSLIHQDLLSQSGHESRNFGGPPVVKKGVIQQSVDHFSADPRVFNQRYFYSNYSAGKSSPVILYVCPESRCGESALWGPLTSHAQFFRSFLFTLEHRFYGDSQPFADLSIESLKYLTTDQALEDLVQFKIQMQMQFGLTGPWIIVGGSYAGNLASFARSRYPQHFAAALASSAPVKIKDDFYEWDEFVAGRAGTKCAASVQQALKKIEFSVSNDESFAKVKSDFQATSKTEEEFLDLLADITSAGILFDMRDQFCKAVEERGLSGLQEMKLAIDKTYGDFGEYSLDYAEKSDLQTHSKGFGWRQWLYQSCTEYGYWQNANRNGLSARSSRLNDAYRDKVCMRLFKIPAASTITSFKKFYNPLLTSASSKIFFTYGVNDPWTTLSWEKDQSSGVQKEVMIIPNALHCDDISRGGSSPEVQRARARFRELMGEWLGSDSCAVSISAQ